jgi:hypothetical protein
MSTWNLGIENNEIVINLSIEQQAAATALLAAARAESAKAGAETAEDGAATSASQAAASASDALDSEQAALASQQAAANSASEALTSKNAAANSASDALASKNAALASENAAAQSASSALASKNAATQSETNAGNSASTASTQAGIATDKANLATEKATLAGTKADEAAQSAADALAHKNSAQSSASTATTQANLSTDKAALATTKANEALQSANNALASEQAASASEAIALQAQGQAEYAAVQAGTSASVAQQAANDAVAVVTGGTASLTPEAGKIPIADSTGKIDAGWIDPVSGIDSQALHRSPNAVTSMFIYDTSKDSDGGAWTEKCQHTSWYNEAINGKWLGRRTNEAAARAVTGATTNDYYQQTSDGRFYQLNAGSGITEVFRGNKRSFPKIAGIVAESGNLTIYDLTETGNPMWMRFLSTTSTMGVALTSVSCVTSLNSFVYVGSTGSGLSVVRFINDDFLKYTLSVPSKPTGNISSRNASLINTGVLQGSIKNNTVNAIAMTFTADAPIDPATGLKVPTIAIATLNGISIINSKGQVVSNSFTFVSTKIYLTKTFVLALRNNADWFFSKTPDNLPNNFAMTTLSSNQEATVGVSTALINTNISNTIRSLSSSPLIKKGNINIDTPAKTLSSSIAPTYNTGYLVGDIRRAYLADSVAESVGPSVELVTNGTFDTDVSGWNANGAATSVSYDNGVMRITNIGGNTSFTSATQVISSLVVGRTYLVSAFMSVGVTGPNFGANIGADENGTGGVGLWTIYNTSGIRSGVFVATGTSMRLSIWGSTQSPGGSFTVDNVSLQEVIPDSSFRSRAATAFGTLLRSLVATGADLVGFSGFSNSNYLQEPYSSELDFGTGEVHLSAWVNVPVSLTINDFPVLSSNLVPNGSFDNNSSWVIASNLQIVSGALTWVGGGTGNTAEVSVVAPKGYYVLRFTASDRSTGSMSVLDLSTGLTTVPNISGSNFITSGNGIWILYSNGQGSEKVKFNFNSVNIGYKIDNVELVQIGSLTLFERSFSIGPLLKVDLNPYYKFEAVLFDGTTTRTVTTPASYNLAQWVKVEANYIAGRLSLLINGVEVAATTGNPLLTLNNASAVLTIGNNFELDAPFPGSLALVKLSATTPSAEQSLFMYEQEKQLFRENAKCILPDANTVIDLSYNEVSDQWVAVSSANESTWTGLVRNSVRTPATGAFSRVETRAGFKLMARTTTNIGVDISKPSYGILQNMLKKAEDAARLTQDLGIFDFVGGFTATTVNGNVAITAVANLSYPQSFIGARVSGAGIPANTTIVGVSGTTIFLSDAATASASNVNISFLDFNLPAGFDPTDVKIAGVTMREGATRDYIKLYDGFKQTVRFAVAPSATAWVQIICKKEIA